MVIMDPRSFLLVLDPVPTKRPPPKRVLTIIIIIIIIQLVSVCGKWIVLIKEILVLCHNHINNKFSYCFQHELIKMVLKMSSLQIYLSNLGGMSINVRSGLSRLRRSIFSCIIKIQRARMLEFFFSGTFLCSPPPP